MKKYRVTLKVVYELEASNPTEAEDMAHEQFVKDGTQALASTVAEVKPKVVVDESQGD